MKRIFLLIIVIFSSQIFAQKAYEIYQIQGSGLESQYVGQSVTTQNNIVTIVLSNSFYIQTPDSRDDNNPETSNGIAVYTSSTPSVQSGDLVNVTGTIAEYYGLTEITSPTVTEISHNNTLPTAILWDENTPSPIRPQAENSMERFEGMLVEFYNGMTTSGTNLHGDFYAVAHQSGRTFREPGIDYPGQTGLPVWDANPEVFEIDTYSDESSAVKVKGGNLINYIKGVVRFSFDEFGIFPINLDVNTDITIDAVSSASQDEYSVGSINLLAFNDDESTTYTTRKKKISKYIREVLGSPDIIAVQEVQDAATLNGLITQISQDDPTVVYSQYLEDTDWAHNNVAFLYKNRLTISGFDIVGESAEFYFGGQYYDTFDRAPLKLEATVNGFSFRLLNLHLRSRNDIDDPSLGGFVREKRYQQSIWLSDYIQDFQNANPNSKIMVAGDLNQFEFTDGYVDVLGEMTGIPDPLGAMYEASTTVNPTMVNLAYKIDKTNRFSYVYEGNAQILDHIIVNQNFEPYISYIKYPHANSDYPEYYEDDVATAMWATDHDGVVARFKTTQVAIEDEILGVNEFHLFQNYPNPFNPQTEIKFKIIETGNVKLTIFNSLAEEVATLANQEFLAGTHSIAFHPENLPSGIYFYKIECGNFMDVKKMVLMK
jgi:predicted extracellular nuclease